MSTIIRKLTSDDWQAYKTIRLKALQTDPSAFGRLYEEEEGHTDEEWRSQLSGLTGVEVYGAFADNVLVGIMGVRFEKGKMFSHMANLFGMYVDSDYQGKGIGSAIIKNVTEAMRKHSKIVKIRLSVNTTQKPALELYKKAGFKQVGLSHYEAKIDNQWLDQIQMDMMFEEKISQ